MASGVCHTDTSVINRPFPVTQPIVLGHEGAGLVESVGRAVTKVRPGDRVVPSFNFCGRCPTCLGHAPSYCEYFFGQSSFATYCVSTEHDVVKVPDNVPDALFPLLGPLGCGIQTGALLIAMARRKLSIMTMLECLKGTASTTAMIFAIVFGALVFANFVTLSGLTAELVEMIRGSGYSVLGVLTPPAGLSGSSPGRLQPTSPWAGSVPGSRTPPGCADWCGSPGERPAIPGSDRCGPGAAGAPPQDPCGSGAH